MTFNLHDEDKHNRTCKNVFGEKSGLLPLVATTPNDQHSNLRNGSWLVLEERFKVVNRKLAELNAHREQQKVETPMQYYLPTRPLSARLKWCLSLVGLILLELFSWGNGAWFAQQTLGEDKIWGALALTTPVVIAPFVLELFIGQFENARSKINKVLLVIFGIAFLGFCSQFASKFATVDNSQASFQVNWSDHESGSQKPQPSNYAFYLACQLVLECLGSLSLVTCIVKFGGPQINPKTEKIKKEISRIDHEMQKLEAEQGLLIFNLHRLSAANEPLRPLQTPQTY